MQNQCTIETNNTFGTEVEIETISMPLSGFNFIIVENIGSNGYLTRRTYISTDNPFFMKKVSDPKLREKIAFPEKYGIIPIDSKSNMSIAEHVLPGSSKSSFTSASEIFPDGAPRFINDMSKPVYIDIKKLEKAGAQLISTNEIIDKLNDYKKAYPHLEEKVNKFIDLVQNVDRETLIKGDVPSNVIYSEKGLKISKIANNSARVVQVFGVAFTAYDLNLATQESVKIGSIKPISAEVVRQAGGWGAAWGGFKIGAATGAAVTVETGPGAFIGGIVGGIIFGTAGYFGADWIADFIYDNETKGYGQSEDKNFDELYEGMMTAP